MDKKIVGYWVVTGLFTFALGASGLANALLVEDMAAAMEHLGYPAYFARILGTWKLLGAVALLAPGLPRLKEWATAGFTFTLTGAFVSHLAVGDALGDSVAPLVLLGLLAASTALRPADRRLGTDGVGAGSTPQIAVSGTPAAA